MLTILLEWATCNGFISLRESAHYGLSKVIWCNYPPWAEKYTNKRRFLWVNWKDGI